VSQYPLRRGTMSAGMAPRVGQALREARAQRGIALNDVERVTGIRVQHLRALEEERWDQLPGHAEARRALSSYARYLGLDEESLLAEYEGSRQRPKRSHPVPTGVVRRPGRSRNRSPRPYAALAVGVVAVLLLGVALVAALGSNGGDDDNEGRPSGVAEKNRGGETTTSESPPTTTTASEVSLQLTASADVWVCLVGADGTPALDGETLSSGEARGPFTGRRFEMTFGNGSIELTADGDPVEVPPLAEPLGYRVTPEGAKRLAPGAGPTCS
jgi:transcriptional regulator with XRE-family HTH domain